MNLESYHKWRHGPADAAPDSPILLVPYMWIGDFVRCHTVVKLLKQRFPARSIDVLTTAMVSPLLDYMPGVRKGIIVDLPRRQLALGQHLGLPRMVERCATLALPRGESPPAGWPLPELVASTAEVATWRQRLGLMPDKRIVIALAPGAVGPAKRWPVSSYADLGRRLVGEGHRVWIVGGPSECALAAEIAASAPDAIRNLTGSDLRNAILALAA